MKRTALLLVAILGLVVASAVQAAEVNVKFYSQVGNAPVDVADDVRFTLMSAEDGTVVFDSATAESADIAEGSYTMVAEQPSTHLFGSVEVAFSDADEAKKLFLLSNEGLAELEGAHECDNEGHCDCDENCICRLINHNCTERVSGCDDNIAIANVPATLQTAPATQPVYPLIYISAKLWYARRRLLLSATTYLRWRWHPWYSWRYGRHHCSCPCRRRSGASQRDPSVNENLLDLPKAK
jgi:hypothetical protein